MLNWFFIFQVATLVPEGDLSLKPPGGCPETIARVMESCWERDASKRPSFAEIVRRLEEAPDRNQEPGPPPPPPPPSTGCCHSNPTYDASSTTEKEPLHEKA